MTAGSANRHLTYLRAVLAEAVKWGWIPQNPASNISKLSEPKGRVRFLDDEEREALLKACKASPSRVLYPLVLAAISFGARAGELLALRWANVDWAKGIGVIHDSKNGEARRASGATLLEIAEVLGHKTLAMTMRYSHLTSSHVADVVDKAMVARLGAGR